MSQKRKNKKGFWSSFFKNGDVDESEDFINLLEGSESKKIPVDFGGLMEAPSGQRFFIFEGPSLKSLQDLNYYLTTMTDRQINHHISEERNDFASWVRDVLKQNKLASDFEKTRSREEMLKVLNSFLNSK